MTIERQAIFTADPGAGYREQKLEIDTAISAVLDHGHYVDGPAVEHFERSFAGYIGMPHGIGVNSGTDAIHLALRALGIGSGDEVVTASHTSAATVEAIVMAGAAPVLADADPVHMTLSPASAEEAISRKTRAIIAVNLYGQVAELETLRGMCAANGLVLIEDCAQSHGASHRGKLAGSYGDVSCFSFYPTKILGAIGDAGMVLARDEETVKALRMLRQHGWDRPQHSVIAGWNSRLDPIQAAVLSVKLGRLPAMIETRRAVARNYLSNLGGLPLVLPGDRAGSLHAYHLFVVQAESQAVRDALRAHLARCGISAGIHYPYPVHLQPAFSSLPRPVSLKESERLSDVILSLPVYPELTEDLQQRVVAAVTGFFAGVR